jgi:cell division protein FtsB
MVNAQEIFHLHDHYLSYETWPENFILQHQSSGTVYEFIEMNHFFNTKLWNEEDLARRQKVSASEIAKNKREIDKFNQARNDCIEKIDDFILQAIPKLSEMLGKQNSETLGGITDRLSILSLKIFHMSIQTKRTDTSQAHRDICSGKLRILINQRSDLVVCYDELQNDCLNGLRHFKQYKQFKMYNDPNLNPQIYSEK